MITKRNRPAFFSLLLGMIRTTVAVFRARETPCYVKLILAAGLLYVTSPLDLVPEWLSFIGLADDFTLAALLIARANGFRPPPYSDSNR